MIKLTKNVFLIAALIGGTIGFTSCNSTSTNTTANNTTANKNTTVTNTTTTTTTTTEKTNSSATNTTETASKGDKIGVPECDEFIEKYEACISSSKVPETTRAEVKKSIEQWRTSWKKLAANPQTKSTLTAACKQTMESAKQTSSAWGCTW